VATIQQPHPGGQLGVDVDDLLAGHDQLLGKVVAQPAGALDRPVALGPTASPGQQPGRGLGTGEDRALANGLLALVNRDGDIGVLVRVDPDDDHQRLLSTATRRRHSRPVVGTLTFQRPRSRACIEPRHGRTTTGGTL
jgi:hypothetical protein